jgi:hypothetical protein
LPRRPSHGPERQRQAEISAEVAQVLAAMPAQDAANIRAARAFLALF